MLMLVLLLTSKACSVLLGTHSFGWVLVCCPLAALAFCVGAQVLHQAAHQGLLLSQQLGWFQHCLTHMGTVLGHLLQCL